MSQIKAVLPSDYSYCLNHKCPARDNCHRYQSAILTNNPRMVISDFKPEPGKDKCDSYIPITEAS